MEDWEIAIPLGAGMLVVLVSYIPYAIVSGLLIGAIMVLVYLVGRHKGSQ